MGNLNDGNGHGHVRPRADGAKARCGGPGLCGVCREEYYREAERLLLIAASHCQGGHSSTGADIANLFHIPFPLRMEGLEKVATDKGYDPKELWPWLHKQRQQDQA